MSAQATVVALVEQMLALHKDRQFVHTLHEQSVLAATDRQMAPCARPAIDRLVYEPYEPGAIVAGSCTRRNRRQPTAKTNI